MSPDVNVTRFSPKSFLRARRPEKFSDSVVSERSALDRTLLEYHLDTVTNRSEETRFETFARKLAEREIAPNLIPHTGPTGGGDSKVDSETYPVAEQLAQGWYHGQRGAAHERWAFAFSAKKDWRTKVRADIKQIAGTNRGYKVAYFISNQFIPDKKRAATEDSLRKDCGLDVRILDRTWILDKVFDNHREALAISELGISVPLTVEIRRGPLDIQREQELEELEARIEAALRDTPGISYVDDCIESALLARNLERPRVEIDGRFARAQAAADQHGTRHQQVVAYYQHAWATFWWFEDYKGSSQLYQKVEQLALDSRNATDLELLTNLWTLLFAATRRNDLSAEDSLVDKRRRALTIALRRLRKEEDRPSTALQARTHLARIRLISEMGRPAAAVLRELRAIVETSAGLVGYPLMPLSEIITEAGQHFVGNQAYEQVFETVVEVTGRRKGEVAAARLLLKRGAEQLDADRPYEAIRSLGRALGDLYKHESRHHVVRALYLCAGAYERVGLLWAARGTLLNAASVATNEWWSYSEINPAQAACYNRTKWVELQIGRVPHVLAWHEIDSAVRVMLAKQGFPADRLARGEVSFDAILGMLLLRLDIWQLKRLERLPRTLDVLGLPASALALSYALGHKDGIPAEAAANDENVQKFFEELVAQPAGSQLPPQPMLYDTPTIHMHSVVLGCHINVSCQNASTCVHLGESLLAAVESLLSTSLLEGIIPRVQQLDISIRRSDFVDALFAFEIRDISGLPVLEIRTADFPTHGLTPEDQRALRERLFEVIVQILSRAFLIGDIERELTRVFGDEQGLQRAIDFTSSFGTISNVLGVSPKVRIEDWFDKDAPPVMLRRTEEWDAATRRSKETASAARPTPTKHLQPGKGDIPPELKELRTVKHSEVRMLSLIREPLWDQAKWRAIGYVTSREPGMVPIMAFGFENGQAAAEIFQHWIRELGHEDPQNRLRVSIIRGISRKNPHHYRVVVGTNPTEAAGTYFAVMSRVHTMTPDSDANIGRFLAAYEFMGRYQLAAAQFDSATSVSPIPSAVLLKKELVVREAWQIGRHDVDVPGILESDDIIIPNGQKNAPVLEVLEWKRTRNSRRRTTTKRRKKRKS